MGLALKEGGQRRGVAEVEPALQEQRRSKGERAEGKDLSTALPVERWVDERDRLGQTARVVPPQRFACSPMSISRLRSQKRSVIGNGLGEERRQGLRPCLRQKPPSSAQFPNRGRSAQAALFQEDDLAAFGV